MGLFCRFQVVSGIADNPCRNNSVQMNFYMVLFQCNIIHFLQHGSSPVPALPCRLRAHGRRCRPVPRRRRRRRPPGRRRRRQGRARRWCHEGRNAQRLRQQYAFLYILLLSYTLPFVNFFRSRLLQRLGRLGRRRELGPPPAPPPPARRRRGGVRRGAHDPVDGRAARQLGAPAGRRRRPRRRRRRGAGLQLERRGQRRRGARREQSFRGRRRGRRRRLRGVRRRRRTGHVLAPSQRQGQAEVVSSAARSQTPAAARKGLLAAASGKNTEKKEKRDLFAQEIRRTTTTHTHTLRGEEKWSKHIYSATIAIYILLEEIAMF